MTQKTIWLSLLLAHLLVGGCDDSNEQQRLFEVQQKEANQRAAEAREEARQARVERERDRRVLAAQQRAAVTDRDSAIVLWQATVLALLVTLVLLAWQIRAWRLLSRRLEGMEQKGGTAR